MSLCVSGRRADQPGGRAQDGAGGRGALRVGRRLSPRAQQLLARRAPDLAPCGAAATGGRACVPVAACVRPRPGPQAEAVAAARRACALTRSARQAAPGNGRWPAQPANLLPRHHRSRQAGWVPRKHALQSPRRTPSHHAWRGARALNAVCPHQHASCGPAVCMRALFGISALGALAHGLAQRRGIWA